MAQLRRQSREQNDNRLAEPFSQIFIDRPEAEWAFALLQETARRLGLSNAYDERFALTLPHPSGKMGLHLNFGRWLVLGFTGPGQTPYRVELVLLANHVAWDERLEAYPFTRKEGQPEVRSYQLPVEIVRPLTSELQTAYETTLDFIAAKFHTWKRSPYWQHHNPEIIAALFDVEQRERLFAGELSQTELVYERHYTPFYQDISEEEATYEIASTVLASTEVEPSEAENEVFVTDRLQRRRGVNLDREKIRALISLIRTRYPNWSGFSDPDFVSDEVEYKQVTVTKAHELLSQPELSRLIAESEFDEFINRLGTIGKDLNLLWLSVPSSGDLNILYDSNLDKPTFCEAVTDLLYGPGETNARLERYLAYVKSQSLHDKWTFPTYFLFLCYPKTEMFVKPLTTKWFLEFFDSRDQYTTRPTVSTYSFIKQLAHQLKDELQEYQPKDMVDIQSLIWVCYSASQPEGKDVKEKLATPFSEIFTNREEAEWAFEFLRESFDHLGITGPNDQRFSLTLARRYGGLNLHFNLGNWLVLGFRQPNLNVGRVRIPFIADLVDFEDQYIEYDFAQDNEQPNVISYGLPIEQVRFRDNNLNEAYHATLIYISERFGNYGRSPWRKHHMQVIAEAIFDVQKRQQLFDEDLSDELVYVDEETELNPIYPLSELAEETGLDEAELDHWVRAIERKGQAILYGPPGTGKTYLAEKLAAHLIGGGAGFKDLIQFHPAYAYEDFIQGIRPVSDGERLSYPLVRGRFLEFCDQARTCQGHCVLIIDEINRANLARVFGELMYLLEYRERKIPLAGGGTFEIPANVRLIGTMNTADRSIALVDHALRRRFAFIALYPNYDILRRYHRREQTDFPVEGLIDTLQRLNRRINDPHYEVGITFFLQPDLALQIEDIWRMEIEPYLEEYFFDQPRETLDDFRWEAVKQKVAP